MVAVLESIRAKAGKGSARLLSDGSASDIVEVVPTGIDVLDHHVLGCGGWPVGRIVELFADEGLGKSSMMFQSVAGVQRLDGIPTIVETEYALDSSRAQVFGCDTSRCILAQTDDIEEALQIIESAVDGLPKSKKGDPPNFIGWDSLAGTGSKEEAEKGMDSKERMGGRALLMGKAMRVLTSKCAEKRAILMVLNQTRQKIGLVFGDPTTTPGGAALKFHASVRLRLMGGKAVKNGEDHIGKVLTMMTAKNKCGGMPFAKGRVRLDYNTGWNNVWSTINFAKDKGLVDKKLRPTIDNYKIAVAALGWPEGYIPAVAPGTGDEETSDFPDEE